MKYPDYHCAERTLDVALPWGGVTIRLWFDAHHPQWSDAQKLTDLGHTIRRNERYRTGSQDVLDELAAMPGVNAVQVRQVRMPGVEFGYMAYTVPFSDDAPAPVQVVHSEEGAAAIEKLKELQWHGCLTGDCNHTVQEHCNASLADAYREAFK